MELTKNNDVLQENEFSSNRAMVMISFVTALFFASLWFVSELKILDMYEMTETRIAFFSAIMLLCLSSSVSIYFKYKKSWIKHLLMTSVILALAMIEVIYTHNVTIIIVIPIVLSSRYFSEKYTLITSGTTFLVFLIARALGACFGAIDLNCLELPAGTVIDLSSYTWLYEIIEDGIIAYDKEQYLFNVLIYGYAVDLVFVTIVATTCVLIALQGKKLINRQKEMTEHTVRVDTELKLASTLQMDMVPNKFPAFPERDEFDLFASMTPAKEVGGDFYDFFLIDDDHLYIVIADVSGKGIPAAMFMMLAKGVLANQIIKSRSPAQALADANEELCRNNTNSLFVTVWLGILTISTGKLVAANAGHEFPVIKDPGGSFEYLKDKHGLVLGGRTGMKYTEYEIDLKPGSKLFVYTDGAPEANNEAEEQFGADRLLSSINQTDDPDPKEIITGMRSAIEKFTGDAEQFDDLTMLCLEYKGK